MAGPSIVNPTALPAMPNPKPIEVMNGAGLFNCRVTWKTRGYVGSDAIVAV